MHDNASALVNEEERFFLDHDDPAELLLELGSFLERLQADPIVREPMGDMRREAEEMLAKLRAIDAANVERLKAVRCDLPKALTEAPEGAPLNDFSAFAFDRLVARPPHDLADILGRGDREDPGRAKEAAFILRMIIGDAGGEDFDSQLLTAQVRQIEEEQAHAFRRFSVQRLTHPGFSLERLLFVLHQLNPRPEHQGGWNEYIDDRMRRVIGEPEFLQALVHGSGPLRNDAERQRAAEVESTLRIEVRRICRDLRRRIGLTRSRVALVNEYALRCSWYDATAMADLAKRLAGRGKQKEDPLSDHLARFLFDHGLRPLTRAMVGRLVPDVFDPSPPSPAMDRQNAPEVTEPAFYIEAKQYDDRDGALKAVRDAARQIWSSADRIRKRYPLKEAFLVVFRRGGPLLRFPDDPVRSDTLTIRPVLVDVAGGNVSGSRQGEVIHVKPEQILAERRSPSMAAPRRSPTKKGSRKVAPARRNRRRPESD